MMTNTKMKKLCSLILILMLLVGGSISTMAMALENEAIVEPTTDPLEGSNVENTFPNLFEEAMNQSSEPTPPDEAIELTEDEQIWAGMLDGSMRRSVSSIPHGLYYITNAQFGKFLFMTDTTQIVPSFYEDSDMQIGWEIIPVEPYLYAIYTYNGEEPYFIGVQNGQLATVPYSSTPPANCLWEHVNPVGGGVIFRNQSSGQVLQSNGTTISVGTELSSDHADYKKTVWRVLEFDNFRLMEDFTLNNDWVKAGSSHIFFTIPTPSNASWTMSNCFSWTITPHNTSNVFTVSANGTVTAGSNGGTATLTVTYKLTGQTKTFRIASGAVREDIYHIRNERTGRYLDIEGPNMNNNTSLQQWQYHGGSWETWRLIINPTGDYSIQSVYSDKYVYVANGSTVAGAPIVQNESMGPYHARWIITATESGNYRLTPRSNSALALGVPMGQDGDGVNLQQIPYGADADYSDEWIFETAGPTAGIKDGGIYHILAKHSNKALDVMGAGMTDGTVLNQFPVTAGYQWQRWKFEYQGNGEYKIRDMNSGKLLSIAGSSYHGDTISHIWTSDNTTGQVFKIRANDDESYTFLSKCTVFTQALTVRDGNTANGANVIQSLDIGADYQRFYLRESVADFNFLCAPIEELYQYAHEYIGSPPIMSVENLTLKDILVSQYLRRSRYDGDYWDMVAGEINQDFIDYVDSRNGLLKIMFNGNPTDTFPLAHSAGEFLYDADGNKIDFYHLWATLNAIEYDSAIIDGVEAALPDMYIDALSGWAGDLQQLMEKNYGQLSSSNDYAVIYTITRSMLGNDEYQLAMEDLYADVDAVHIQNLGEDILTAIKQYYTSPTNRRITNFIGDRTKEELYNDVRIYTQETSVVPIKKWPIIEAYTFTETQSNAIAQAFTDFLWELMEAE